MAFSEAEVPPLAASLEPHQTDQTQTEPTEQKPQSNSLDYLCCGVFAGFCSVIVGHPFDNVILRMQTDPKVLSPIYMARLMWQSAGIRGFYSGFSVRLASIVPDFGIVFMGYKVGKSIVSYFKRLETNDFEFVDFVMAGTIAGAFAATVATPVGLVMCKMQMHRDRCECKPKTVRKSAMAIVKDLYKENGTRSLFRGFGPTFIRDVPATAMYFTTYSMMMKFFEPPEGLDYCKAETHFMSMFAGGCSGIAYWTVGLPAEVLKNRVQTADPGMYPNGTIDAFKHLIVAEGPLALYRGVLPCMLKAFPANAACFFGFELMRTFIYHMRGIRKCPREVMQCHGVILEKCN